MRKTVQLRGKKAGALIHVSDLIVDRRQVVYFTGFGPTQEVRAFAQLLNSGEAELSLVGDEETFSLRACRTDFPIQVAKGPEGHSLIYCLPRDTSYIVAASEQEGREVYYRLLEQESFVLREWFPVFFAEVERVEPVVGEKFCLRNSLAVEARVKEGLRKGEFQFPEPTASLILEQSTVEEKAA